MNSFSRLSLALFISSHVFAGQALAGEFVPNVGIIVESASNITKGNDNSATRDVTADTVVKPFVGFQFSESVDKVNSEITFKLEHQQYVDDTFGAQDFFTIDGFLDYEVIPGRFIWATEDAANTRRIVLQEPGTPDNLQTFNVFTTGPDIFLTRDANEYVIKGRVGNVTYSDELADNLRLLGTAAVTRAVSPVMNVGLATSATIVRFEEEFQTDYDLYSLTAKFDRETPWGAVGLIGGYNFFDFETGFTESEPLVEGTLVVGGKEDSANTLTLSAAYKFSDPASDVFDPNFTRLFEVQGVGTVDTEQRAGTGATKTQRFESTYEHRGDLYGIKFFGFYQDLDRPLADQESQRETGVGVNFGYALTPNVNVWASYFKFESDFFTSGDHIEGTTPAIGFNWQLSENVNLAVGAKMEEEIANTPDRGFEDESVYIALQYQGVSRIEK